MTLARGKQEALLKTLWSVARSKRHSLANPTHPFQSQGGGKNYTYKLFLEVGHVLLTQNGRLGFIVPSGLYSDSGTKTLRELFLEQSSWEWLFSFENKKKIFDIHGSFKFAAVIVARKQAISQNAELPLRAAFMVHLLSEWERPDPPVFEFDRSLIPLFSPRSKSLPEVRTPRDLDICRKIYANSIRIGDDAPGWKITYSQEFNMTSDSKLFPPLEKWKAKGYQPDVFGRWIGPDGIVALPLYEGRMIGQFDFSQKGWVSGKGRSAEWRNIPFDNKTVVGQRHFDTSFCCKCMAANAMGRQRGC